MCSGVGVGLTRREGGSRGSGLAPSGRGRGGLILVLVVGAQWAPLVARLARLLPGYR